MTEVTERKHPIYWFDDGSIIIDVEVYQFKVHNTLVSRHSRYFSSLSAKRISLEPLNGINQCPPSEASGINRMTLDTNTKVRASDVEALLQHLYHDVRSLPDSDVCLIKRFGERFSYAHWFRGNPRTDLFPPFFRPLRKDSPIAYVASLLRVSSPQQLDYPVLHESVKDILQGMFPTDPASFTHNHPLHDALPVATEFNLRAARKAILYSLVTTTEFDISNPTTREDPQNSGANGNRSASKDESMAQSESSTLLGGPPTLSAVDSEICTILMTRLIDYFSPVLFTAPAASHMECTDIFADKWMSLVIQPAIDNDGVYRPLETLRSIKEINWQELGLCASCAAAKQEEWTEEQRTIWNLIDSWI